MSLLQRTSMSQTIVMLLSTVKGIRVKILKGSRFTTLLPWCSCQLQQKRGSYLILRNGCLRRDVNEWLSNQAGLVGQDL